MRPLFFLLLTLFSRAELPASVISINGAIEATSYPPRYDETDHTLDFLKFRVTQAGLVTLSSQAQDRLIIAVVQVSSSIPGGLDYSGIATIGFGLHTASGMLGAGEYFVVLEPQRSEYAYSEGILPNYRDRWFDFVVNRPSTYSLTLDGPVEFVEYRQGNLDGTWTIIPEPSAACLGVMAAVLGLRRRREVS
jgi:hypothetical protein